jgi:hypothetical protein
MPHTRSSTDVYRPFSTNWDPTRWVIWILHNFTSLIPTLHKTSDVDVLKARLHMVRAEASSLEGKDPLAARRLKERASILQQAIPSQKTVRELPTWSRAELEDYVTTGKRRVLLIEARAVDVTSFGQEHVRVCGRILLLQCSQRKFDSPEVPSFCENIIFSATAQTKPDSRFVMRPKLFWVNSIITHELRAKR